MKRLGTWAFLGTGLIVAGAAVGCAGEDPAPVAEQQDLFGCSTTSLAKQHYEELPAKYESLSAKEKLETLWRLLSETEYSSCPPPTGGTGFTAFASAKPLTSLDVSFNHSADEMPAGRKKFLHPFGSVATFDFIKYKAPNDGGPEYTGVLKPNETVRGVIRLSLAGDPNVIGYTPGMALKFLIDGAPSVNIHVMNSLMGQDHDTNWFRKDFTNVLADPRDETSILEPLNWAKAQGLVVALEWFKLFYPTPNHLHVDHLAFRDQTGATVEEPVHPYALLFEPNAKLEDWWDQQNPSTDSRTLFKRLGVGSVLYQVYAIREEGANPEPIGQIKTTSKILPSQWGDFRLFFRHNNTYENDDVRP